MSFSIRRRLSSIIAPFTVAGSPTAATHPANRTRHGGAVRGQCAIPEDESQDDIESTSDDWDRKSYDVSEAASRRSFDLSGSEATSDSETQHACSDTSDVSTETESEDDAEMDDKYDLMASHLYQVAEGKGWFRSSKAWGNSTGIVSIR